jgi:CDP-glucose 4,6-dehydratase
MKLDQQFWKNKRVLITGHTGFKGSWLSLFMQTLGSKVYGISREEKEGIYIQANLKKIFEKEYFLDIGEKNNENLSKILEEVNPDIVFHFAAQSLVYVAHTNPLDTLNSNVIGTYNILNSGQSASNLKSVIVATTDKVYKNSSIDNIESSELGGTEFYSSSKVAAENVITAFANHELNYKISVVRSGNVIGGGDRAEKRLVTELLHSLKTNKDFFLRKPKSIRPWQFVLDSIYGYILVAQENYLKSISEIYNLNSDPNNKYDANYIARQFALAWKSSIGILVEDTEKFKEVDILTINSSKAYRRLNWKPLISIDELVELTVLWEKNYLHNNSSEFSILQIRNYLNLVD